MFTGVRKQTASDNAFNGGLNCFGCSTIYELPTPDVGPDKYYADDFDFLDAETHRSNDPMAYMPGEDWTTLMQR
jgi:hypothetical protein